MPSQSGNGAYSVLYTEKAKGCSCLDFEQRGPETLCKHVLAISYHLELQARDGSLSATLTASATISKRPTYPQDWPRYN